MVKEIKKGEISYINGYIVSDKEWDVIQNVLKYTVVDKIAHDRIKNKTISKVSSSEVKV